MKRVKNIIKGIITWVSGLFLFATPVIAAHFVFFGVATVEPSGNPGNAAKLVSDSQQSPGYGVIDITPASPLRWNELSHLSLDFTITDDDCGGESPRFALGVDAIDDENIDGYVFVSFGPSPNFINCSTGWLVTGNLIGNEDQGRYNFGQLWGSSFSTYSAAPDLVKNGTVRQILVVVDGWWNEDATGGDGEQTVLIDNVNINGHVTTFDGGVSSNPVTLKDCKKGAWVAYANPAFKNQGDCVRSVAGKSKAKGR